MSLSLSYSIELQIVCFLQLKESSLSYCEIFFWLYTWYLDLISYCGVVGSWMLLGILCLENKKVQEF